MAGGRPGLSTNCWRGFQADAVHCTSVTCGSRRARLRHGQAGAAKAAQRAGIEHAKAEDGAAYRGRKPGNTYQQFSLLNLNRIKTRMLAIRYRTKMRMMPY
jgi:hypothetical protein